MNLNLHDAPRLLKFIVLREAGKSAKLISIRKVELRYKLELGRSSRRKE